VRIKSVLSVGSESVIDHPVRLFGTSLALIWSISWNRFASKSRRQILKQYQFDELVALIW
jgi:hypothetical protein